MVSSTFTDLEQHRAKVIEAIGRLGFRPNVMETSGPCADADVIDASLRMVRDSAAYIGVIGHKYGQTPFCPDRNPDRLSISELEFNEAMRLKRPVLLFIMGTEHPVKPVDVETEPDKRKKLDAFRERAKVMREGSEVQRVYSVFNDREEFIAHVATAIGQLTQDLDRPAAVEAANSPAEPTKPQGISNIPIAVPLHFLGRDEDLAAIDTALKSNRGRVAITALHGLRGVGKTVLAAAYAERHRDAYRATWWIRAETESTMRADLVGLGVQLGWVAADEKEEPALAIVKQRLRDDGRGLLLIYDNAVNADAIRAYVQQVSDARLIITSNAPNWRGFAAPVEIEVWPNEVGAAFLTERAGRPDERDAALALSEALGGLPLAHEQAGAYCDRIGTSFADYLNRFSVTPAKYLDDERDAPRDYHDRTTVAKTFTLAIMEAAKLHPAASILIEYAALLAAEPIPLYLFSEAREKFAPAFASLIADEGLDEAVAALRAFALVDRERVPDERDARVVTDCIRLHRLVREVALVRCHRDFAGNARRELIDALASLYSDEVFSEPAKWPQARRLDPLAVSLVSVEEDSANRGAEVASLLNGLACYRVGALSIFADARLFLEYALKLNEAEVGADHVDVARTLNNLGYVLQAQGDREGAKPYVERALAIRERALGPDHPDTAVSLNNLGGLLESLGDLAGGKPFYERALAINEKALGPDHPDTARSLSNLGYLLQAQGDVAGAKPYVERALAIREKALGPDHPDTARDLNNLGGLLQAQGDLAGAKPYYKRALVIRERALGPDHPDTATSLNNVGSLLQAQGDRAGKPYLERALAIRERALGPDHPDTALSLNNLGGLLESQGDFAGAKSYYERALAIDEKVLGPEHPDTARNLNNLGALFGNQGNFLRAKPFLERALGIMERKLGVRHPHTRRTASSLARVLNQLGFAKQAKDLVKRYGLGKS